MSTLNKDERGLGIIELLIIVVIVIAIGAGGYLVYRHNHKLTQTSSPVSASQTSTSPNTNGTSTDNVLTYTSWSSIPINIQQDIADITNILPGSACSGSQFLKDDVETFISTVPGAQVTVEKNDKYIAFSGSCGPIQDRILAADVNGSWHIVYDGEGASLPVCSNLTQFNVPIDFLNKSDTFVEYGSVYQCVPNANSVNAQPYSGPATD